MALSKIPADLITGGLSVDSAAPADAITVDSSGNVGVGTSSPVAGYKLTLTEKMYISNGADVTPDANWSGQLTIGGNGYSGGLALDASGIWLGNNSTTRSVIFATNETERMRIDSAGRVTMPYQPAFHVRGNGTQSWSGSSAYQTLQLNTALLNNGSAFNTSTYTFTAPVAGMYYFAGKITQTTSVTGPAASLFVNGAQLSTELVIAYATAYKSSTGVAVLSLAANDAVTLGVINYNNTSVTLDTARSSLSGFLIG